MEIYQSHRIVFRLTKEKPGEKSIHSSRWQENNYLCAFSPGFTNFMRSPACDIFNPLHNEVNQDMEQPLCNYFIASSHNTYLTGDQLLSHSKTDMYAWVLQSGCRCVEGRLWDRMTYKDLLGHSWVTFWHHTVGKSTGVSNEINVEMHEVMQESRLTDMA